MFSDYDPFMRRVIKVCVTILIILFIFFVMGWLNSGCASEAQQYAQMNNPNCVVEPLRSDKRSETFLVTCGDGRKPFEETIKKRRRR